MANFNLRQTGDEVQKYINSIPVIDVTGTLSGSIITFGSNPYSQIAANYAADCSSIIRLTVGTAVYLLRVTQYDGTNYTAAEMSGAHNVVATIGSASASATIDAGIDATPTQNSNNLVKSGRVWEIGAKKTNVITADVELRQTQINSSGNWSNPVRYKHIIIPVEANMIVAFTARNSDNAIYAFLTSDAEPVNNTPAPIVTGTTRVTIAAGTSTQFTVPNGCNFLYLYGGDGSLGATHVRDHLPDSVTLIKTLESRLNEAESTEELLNNTIGEKNLDLSLYRVSSGLLTTSNTWSNAARYYHILIPVIKGDIISLTANASYSTYYGFLTNDVQAQTGKDAPVVTGTSRVEVPANNSATFTIPDGCNYLYLYGGDGNQGNSHVRDYLPTFVSLKSTISALLDIASNLGYLFGGGIIATNPDIEWRGKMVAAKKRYYTSTITDKPNPVVLAHISDIHGNWSNVRRFVEFTQHHAAYIDGLLNTGDTPVGLFTDGFYNSLVLGNIVANIMNVVGNHDTRGSDGWQQYVGVSVYNALIAPYVSNWGVTQPTDAAANGYCYYYKDYSTQSLRLIVVDIMGYDATEDAWLASVLANARSNGYHVVIATHFAGGRDSEHQEENAFNVMACNYSTLQITSGNASGLYGYNSLAYMMTPTVKSFIDNGGIFVGYIQGHYHLDFVAKLAEDSRQLIYAIGSSKVGETRDYNHVGATRMQDEFQIISIDTFKNTIRLFKVGANIDEFGREKNSICVNYLTQTIIAEGY